MKKFFIKLFIKWFLDKNREIINLSNEDELTLYLFRRPEDVEKMLKSLMTSQILWHFEAKSDEERWVAKGAAMILKIMKNSHRKAIEVYDEQDIDESVARWKSYRQRNRVN